MNIIFRPVEVKDHQQIIKWLNDPEVVRYSEQRHRIHTVASQRTYVASLGPSDIYRLVFLNELPIGTVNAYVDPFNSVANIGIMIGEKALWNNGYGFNAWERLMRLLFDNGIRKIEAGCMGCNMGMIRVFRKSGMKEESRRAHHFIHEKEGLSDLVQYARFNES